MFKPAELVNQRKAIKHQISNICYCYEPLENMNRDHWWNIYILTVAGEMKVYHAMLVGQLQDPDLDQMDFVLVKKH